MLARRYGPSFPAACNSQTVLRMTVIICVIFAPNGVSQGPGCYISKTKSCPFAKGIKNPTVRWEREPVRTREEGEGERRARLQPREWHWRNRGHHSSLRREERVQGDSGGGL